MEFIIANGEVISKREANLTPFLLNDAISISPKVWFGFGGIPLLFENIENIGKQLETFGVSLPPFFFDKRELFRLVKRMLNKNKCYRSGLITFQFLFSAYKVDCLISSEAFEFFDFPMKDNGLLVNFSPICKESKSQLATFRCHNILLWEIAKSKIKSTQLQNSILLNEKDFVCETIGSNLFMIKDGVLVTPALDSGCYNDLMRSLIIEIAQSLKIKILEPSEISKEHVLSMDEIFLASEEQGIQWVLGINNKRFVRECSLKIYEKLNSFLKEKVS